MYQDYDGTLTISVEGWKKAGLTENQLKKDSSKGLLSIYRRGIHGNTLIDVRSIKRPERLKVIEAAYGKVASEAAKSVFKVEIDTAARMFYLNYLKPDGTHLSPENVEKYTNRASIFMAIKNGLERQIAARARAGKRIKMGEFWTLAATWYNQQAESYPCTPIKNPRSFENAFKEFYKGFKTSTQDGYRTIVHKNEGNDAARKVSASLENLLLAIWRTTDKPFINTVHERYIEFISGTRELYDKETGEVFRPADFAHKGRAMEVSSTTVWNYIKDVVNETSVYSDRNGNFDYVNSRRPKQHRKHGRYSLSKISMDDVAMSRKSVRGWVFKYIAVDVVSGYWFRPSYVVGKPNHNVVIEAFRNMFCELTDMKLPMPGELEVEYHLMQDFDWLAEMFPFVRFCESPTEKRAEHAIKSFKYGVSKKMGHTRGRWYSKHEAFRSVRNKVAGDFVEPEYQPQTIVADDLADIEKHNNSLHPLQKTYPGMTRKQVLLANVNPKLQPVPHWHLYRYIGNETETSIYNNDYCPVQNCDFELINFNSLNNLKPNNLEVKAYWLPEEDGSIEKVYLWQGDTYIGEAVNREQYAFNECAIERTDADNDGMMHQNKRLSKYDKFMKDARVEVPKLGMQDVATAVEIENTTVRTVTTATAADYTEDYQDLLTDWKARAISSL